MFYNTFLGGREPVRSTTGALCFPPALDRHNCCCRASPLNIVVDIQWKDDGRSIEKRIKSHPTPARTASPPWADHVRPSERRDAESSALRFFAECELCLRWFTRTNPPRPDPRRRILCAPTPDAESCAHRSESSRSLTSTKVLGISPFVGGRHSGRRCGGGWRIACAEDPNALPCDLERPGAGWVCVGVNG